MDRMIAINSAKFHDSVDVTQSPSVGCLVLSADRQAQPSQEKFAQAFEVTKRLRKACAHVMKKISRKIIERALVYIRTLESLTKEKQAMVSSAQLAEITGFTDVQIRKDISHIAKVGIPRLGYKTGDLKQALEAFVLQGNVVHVALFGVGHLGSAILRYPGFHKDKLQLVAAFDTATNKIGKNINGVTVYAFAQAPQILKKTHSDIGIIAVPKEKSQAVADILVASGIRGIMNFAPTSLTVPKDVQVKDIDLSIEFLSLFCNMQQ